MPIAELKSKGYWIIRKPDALSQYDVRMAFDSEDIFSDLQNETKEENWDGDGAISIDPNDWDSARTYYKWLRHYNLPHPHISPCGDGFIHFNWVFNKTSYTFEFKGPKSFLTIKTLGEPAEVLECISASHALHEIRKARPESSATGQRG